MNGERISKSFQAHSSISLLALGLLAACAPIALAQAVSQTTSQTASLALPDSPGTVFSSSTAGSAEGQPPSSSPFHRAHTQPAPMASPYDKVIAADERAPKLTSKDKMLMGLKSGISPFSAGSWLASAGWSQLVDGAPNFGSDSGAFGERLGAAAIRDISEDFFGTSVMSNVLHEDPRFYQMGRGHSITQRAVYAATRVFVTRSDDGRPTPNFALLSGNLAGSILTNAYYPPQNHGVGQTMKIFAGSIGGSALGFGVDEFLSDALEIVHLKKRR